MTSERDRLAERLRVPAQADRWDTAVVLEAVDAGHVLVDMGDSSRVARLAPGVSVAVGQSVEVTVSGRVTTVRGALLDAWTGTDAKGTWWKYPDGRLEIRHRYAFSSAGGSLSYSWTFPVPFVGYWPFVSAFPRTLAPENVSLSYDEGPTPLTSCVIEYYRSTANPTTVELLAIGRWC